MTLEETKRNEEAEERILAKISEFANFVDWEKFDNATLSFSNGHMTAAIINQNEE